MPKLSIPLSLRDLSVNLRNAFNTVAPDRVPVILLALERIALERPEGESFKAGVSSIQYVRGGLEIEPKIEDLLTNSTLATILGKEEQKVLIALNSRLYARLFTLRDTQKESGADKQKGEQKALQPAGREGKSVLSIDEKRLFLAVKEAVKGLDFTQLLAVNSAAMRLVGALQKGQGESGSPI